MQESLILIIRTLGGVMLFAVLIRFLLQAAGADFYNPVSQSLVKITQPLVAPLRRLIPGYRRFDFAALVLALLIGCLATTLIYLVASVPLPNIGNLISWAFVGMLSMILDIYFFGLLISIIASWIAPYSGNPILILIHQLLEPIQSRFRRVIPPLGGLDFSPIFIFLGIQLVQIMVVATLANRLRVPGGAVIGI